jgi:16S rRNA (cytidine1402-2'-O)-methyltransferase
MSKFYVIATPIGNLGDITFRATETLKSVDLILCEDTRVTKKLLDKYNISKPTMSYHAQSKLSKTDKIFDLLTEGKNLALVSDAGTPGISDPGAMLVSQIKECQRRALTSPVSKPVFDVEVIPIPGPTALITALSASGLPTHEFTFLGFLPHKKGRETLFKEISASKRTMVFYESPHRILKTLESLQKFCPDKKVCLARELTKIYEEFKTGTPIEVLEYLTKNPVKQKGEFTVIVA